MDYQSLLSKIKESGFAEEYREEIASIESSVKSSVMSETEAVKKLSKIRAQFGREKPIVEAHDWGKISNFLDVAEERYIKRARLQFFVGTFAVPIGAAASASSALFGWQQGSGATAIVGLISALLAALSAHSFFVLRVHQQATTAAERLVEKKLALLFLEASLGPDRDDRSKELLVAGTTMFLGHHAPQTLLLSPEDLRKAKDGSQ